MIDPSEAYRNYSLEVYNKIPFNDAYAAVILAVAHDYFRTLDIDDWSKLMAPNSIILDIKGLVPRELNPLRL